jgi:uncharacterized protein (DUF305 family)
MLVLGLVVGYLAHTPPTAPIMSDTAMNHGSMESTMNDMSASLRGKSGDDFDRTFIDEMIVHHQGAIAMAKLVQTTSKRPELLQLANDIITAQTHEIEMMNNWRNEWFSR